MYPVTLVSLFSQLTWFSLWYYSRSSLKTETYRSSTSDHVEQKHMPYVVHMAMYSYIHTYLGYTASHVYTLIVATDIQNNEFGKVVGNDHCSEMRWLI